MRDQRDADVKSAHLALGYGMPVVEDASMVEWAPRPRSPSRARRRAALGHPQHHEWRPSARISVVGGRLVMHPGTRVALEAAIRARAEAGVEAFRERWLEKMERSWLCSTPGWSEENSWPRSRFLQGTPDARVIAVVNPSADVLARLARKQEVGS